MKDIIISLKMLSGYYRLTLEYPYGNIRSFECFRKTIWINLITFIESSFAEYYGVAVKIVDSKDSLFIACQKSGEILSDVIKY